MTETDFVTWVGKAGWSGVALLLAYSVYLATKSMTPEWVARYRAQTNRLTIKDAQRAESIAQKLKINGAEMRVIEDKLVSSPRYRGLLEDGLISSLRFKELFFDARLENSHKFKDLAAAQETTVDIISKLNTEMSQRFTEHIEEDHQVHERVRALEVRVEDVKTDIREIRKGQQELRDFVEVKADQVRDKLDAAEDRIMTVLERRKEPRA